MNKTDIYELIDRFEKSDLTELSLKQGEDKLVLKRGGTQTFVAHNAMGFAGGVGAVPPIAGASGFEAPATDTSAGAATGSANAPEGEIVKAPIVGTFYRAASPDAPPYAEAGKIIKKGETLCIVEAMKSMNEIPADFDLEVLDVLVENGVSVEFDAPLFRVKPL